MLRSRAASFVKLWVVYGFISALALSLRAHIPHVLPVLLVGFSLLNILLVWLAFGPRPDPERGSLTSTTEFLCDTCKLSYGDACRRPERPNATECADYRSQPGGT